MLAVAGEVADGLLCHPFVTERYLREVILPTLTIGPIRISRAYAVCGMPIVATGRDEAELARVGPRRLACRSRSTPRLRRTVRSSTSTAGATCTTRCTRCRKAGRWAEMGERIDDEMRVDDRRRRRARTVAGELEKRFGGMLTRCALSTRPGVDPGDVGTDPRGDQPVAALPTCFAVTRPLA